MNRAQFQADLYVWPIFWALFAVIECLGVFKRHLPESVQKYIPWTSLSQFAWKLESLNPILPWVFMVGLALLLVHIVAQFPYAGRG